MNATPQIKLLYKIVKDYSDYSFYVEAWMEDQMKSCLDYLSHYPNQYFQKVLREEYQGYGNIKDTIKYYNKCRYRYEINAYSKEIFNCIIKMCSSGMRKANQEKDAIKMEKKVKQFDIMSMDFQICGHTVLSYRGLITF